MNAAIFIDAIKIEKESLDANITGIVKYEKQFISNYLAS